MLRLNQKTKENVMRKRTYLILILIAAVLIGAFASCKKQSEKQTASGHKESRAEEEGHEGEEHAGEKREEEKKIVKLDAEDIKEFDIEVREAQKGKLSIEIELPGEITYNADRLAHIVPLVPGVVKNVFKNVGDNVRTGETLAVLESRELAEAKAAYLGALTRLDIARTTLTREETLYNKKISSELEYLEAKKTFDEANIELRSAEQKRHAAGLDEQQVESLSSQPDVKYTAYELKAPFSGTVVEKHITLGEAIKDDEAAFVVADMSTVWINLSVYQKDMPFVKKGQRVSVSPGKDTLPSKGVISFVSPVTGIETRTATARVVLSNSDGLLRPGLFVTAKVVTDEITVPVAIPKTALISEENRTQVFVQTGEGFELMPVSIGRSNGDEIEITTGLSAGQRYVAKGGFTLKAQLSKGAFGDGHNH